MNDGKYSDSENGNTSADVSVKSMYCPPDDLFKKEEKPSLLLHSCCGPCSTAVVEKLYHKFKISIFFYNPNITDIDEYEKRKISQTSFIEQFNEEKADDDQIYFIEGRYEPKEFFKASRGMENEPEGGERCRWCFRMRLERTAQHAVMGSYDFFSTTLTVSPHKNYEIIKKTGNAISVKYGIGFLDKDFKKGNGFNRSIELSKKYGLYRQNYCGCNFAK